MLSLSQNMTHSHEQNQQKLISWCNETRDWCEAIEYLYWDVITKA